MRLLIIGALALVASCATTRPLPPLPVAALAPAYTTRVFENGLTVVSLPRAGVPLVGLSAFVTTGGRTEDAASAGSLHFIEHLVFRGGSPRLTPTSFRKRIASLGDESGGWTWDDEIQFGFEVPSENFVEALDLFAEALMELQWDDKRFTEERQVVLQEIDTTVENPWTRTWNAFDAAMFARHPYGRAVIGDRATVQAMKRVDLERYYRERFTPNHLVIVVAGAVTPDIVSAVGLRFSRYRKGPESFELADVQESEMTAPMQVIVPQRGASSTRTLIGVRTPGAGHPDTAALLVLGELVASPTEGLPSRLERESGWVTDFGADHNPMVDYGQLAVRIEGPTERAATVLRGVSDWLVTIPDRGFSEEAVAAAARHLLVGRARAWERVGDLAQGYGTIIERTGVARAGTLTAEILAQSPDSVVAVARRYLRPERLVSAQLVPEGQATGNAGVFPEPADPLPVPDLGVLEGRRSRGSGWGFRASGVTGATARFEFENGLVLLVRRAVGTPLLSATAYALGGQWAESPEQAGLSVLTGRLLSAGTDHLTARQWDRVLSDRALSVAPEINGDDRSNIARSAYNRDGTTLSIAGTTADRDLIVQLLGEALFRPVFPEIEVRKARESLLAEIAAISDDDLEKTKLTFYDLAYPGHPYGRPTVGTAATVRPLDTGDVRAFHAKNFAPNRLTIAVMGDVDPTSVAELISGAWGDVVGDRAPPLPVCADPEPRAVEERDRDELNGRPLFCINLGAPSVSGADPDVAGIELLMAMARGRHFYKYVYELGVSYRSWARFWPHRGPSPWIVENDLDKARFAELTAEIEADVAALARAPFGDEDLRVAKDRLIIQTVLDAQRTRETSFAMAWGTAIGRPWDAVETEREALKRVTLPDVRRLAGRLFGSPVRYRVLSR